MKNSVKYVFIILVAMWSCDEERPVPNAPVLSNMTALEVTDVFALYSFSLSPVGATQKAGLIYGTEQSLSSGSRQAVSFDFSDGTVTLLLSGLSPDVIYYCKAFAADKTGSFVYSDIQKFRTSQTGSNFTEKSGGLNFDMIFVQGGTFTMGCTGEQGNDCDTDETAHQVTLSSYYIGKYEVTQSLWLKVMGSFPHTVSDSYGKGDNYPVYNVSWSEVQTFVSRLNYMTGKQYRLPTEAEWEYAARGGTKSNGYKYSGSNTAGNVAWYGEGGNGKTHPVGTKASNELGIYDMSGNVDEWCQDWYYDYSSSPQTNPAGPSNGNYRVFRGGNYYITATLTRVSYRNLGWPSDYSPLIGFRLAHRH